MKFPIIFTTSHCCEDFSFIELAKCLILRDSRGLLNDGSFIERRIGEPTNYERKTRIVVISYPYEFYNLKIDERDILVFHHNLLDIPDIYQEIINCIKICRNVYVLDISMKPSEYRSEIRKLGIKANGESIEIKEGTLTEYLLGLREGEIGVKMDGEV